MILIVQMKDPDALYSAIEEAVSQELEKINDLDKDERKTLCVSRSDKANAVAAKWFRDHCNEYSEYITVKIDTEDGTCTVLEVAR